MTKPPKWHFLGIRKGLNLGFKAEKRLENKNHTEDCALGSQPLIFPAFFIIISDQDCNNSTYYVRIFYRMTLKALIFEIILWKSYRAVKIMSWRQNHIVASKSYHIFHLLNCGNCENIMYFFRFFRWTLLTKLNQCFGCFWTTAFRSGLKTHNY